MNQPTNHCDNPEHLCWDIPVDRTPVDGVTGVQIAGMLTVDPVLGVALVVPTGYVDLPKISLREPLTNAGWTQPGTYAHLAAAIRDLLDAIEDMPIRNSDVDAAADVLRGELVDVGWTEPEDASQMPTVKIQTKDVTIKPTTR